MTATRTVVVKSGSGSSAGILLLLLAVLGLIALFTGNLDKLIHAVAGPAGGAAGLSAPVQTDTSGNIVQTVPTPPPAPASPAPSSSPYAGKPGL